MGSRAATLLLLAFVLASARPAAAGEGPVVLDDFEDGEIGPGWKASGARLFLSEEEGRGKSLEVSAWDPDASAEGPIVRRTVPERDLRAFDALAFRISVPSAPLEMQVVFRRGASGRMHWKPLRLEKEGDQAVTVPLRHCNAESASGLRGDFAAVDQIVFRFPKPPEGPVLLDDLRLLPGVRGNASCRRDAAEWLERAFPGGRGKALSGRAFDLLTDRPEYQGEKGRKLLASLDAAAAKAADRFSLPEAREARVPFLLFGARGPMEAFLQGLREEMRGAPPDAEVEGFATALLGMVVVLVRPGEEPDVPILVHAGLHPFVAGSLGLAVGTEWLQESIVAAVHRQLHPESLPADQVRYRSVTGAAFRALLDRRPSTLLPFGDLIQSGGRERRNLTELAALGEFLASLPGIRLGAAWEEVRSLQDGACRAKLLALCRGLGTDPDTLEADWLRWGAANYR